jgi:hypothetical protein
MTTHAYLCILLPHFTIILESIFSMVGWALVRRQAPSCIMHVRMMAGEVEGRGLGEGGEEGMAEGEGGGMGEGG